MLKEALKPSYALMLKRFNQFRYFLLPNLFSKAHCVYEKMPAFQQKTFVTGPGTIRFGENCIFGTKGGGFHYGGSIELQTRLGAAEISIAENVATNNNLFICSANRIRIGAGTFIGQNVTLMDFEAHGTEPEKRNEMGEIGTVNIHENVWIGNNVTILKNSEIGKNSIVATGAVVSGKFPPNVIIGGIPAKVIKNL
ncbi:acyltransferase [Chryseobacterium sp.]|uniref:acyltransferase n=1 Tax=Chryseobacterium sp. TaxID=1871047 RepID=UPI0011CB96E7|nr:acyltransferase [Chryseobacterium sp.]TXF77554.1 acyltransferase [Chryseobacterium sp.]